MADNLYNVAHDTQQIANIDLYLKRQQVAFKASPYLVLQTRITDLKKLKAAILSFQPRLLQALCDDFGHRSFHDSKMGDVLSTIMSINYTLKHLKKWMKPSKRHIGALFQPAKGFVMYQPLGVVGIIAPWNYPLFLSLGPLITALAAGNRALIKLSEFTPNTNEIMTELLASIFSNDQVAVITGGAAVAEHFSKQAFDHIIFTGSTSVGRKVMKAAANNLTPVTLELGGKSPTIIDADIDMDDAVSRFILGKTLNAGQTCVAPDYILCPNARVATLQVSISKKFTAMYPTVADNDDYSAIINQAQLNRLIENLEDARAKGAVVTTLGDDSEENCLTKGKLPLTILTDINDDMVVMKEEIFGPILPIVGYDNIDEAIAYINDRARPLALYLCSHNKTLQQKILENTHSGGVGINDATLQVAQDDLPFGGIGPSGMGQYHGHEGFLTLSKAKSVFKKGKFNSTSFAFPPNDKLIHQLIYRFFIR